jgi:hypothetical protein
MTNDSDKTAPEFEPDGYEVGYKSRRGTGNFVKASRAIRRAGQSVP